MEDYINYLKTKPEPHRRRVALAISGGVTALVFVLWASVMVPHNTQIIAKETSPVSQPKGESPLKALKTSAAQAIQGMKEVWGESSNSVTEIDLNTEYNRIKGQVENGDIKLAPEKNTPESY